MNNNLYKELFTYSDGKIFWAKTVCSRAVKGSRAGYLRGQDGYRSLQLNGKALKEHRVIWELHFGPIPQGTQIDHLNGVRDDNRIENLRLVSQTVNNLNCRKSKNNTSGVNGVSWSSSNFMWRVDFRSKLVAYYHSLLDAVACRMRVEIESGLVTERHGREA